MVITLYGADSYRRNERLRFVVEEYKKKHHAFTCETFDLEGDDGWPRLLEFASFSGLFEPFLLAIVKNLSAVGGSLPAGRQAPGGKSAASPAEVKRFLKSKSEDKKTTIVIAEDSLRDGWEFLVKKPSFSEKIDILKGKDFADFIKKEAIQRKLKMGEAEIDFLATIFNGDSWGLVNELDKIVCWGQEPSLENLKKLGLKKSRDFFQSISGWNYKSIHEKLSELEILWSAKEDSGKIFNIMAYLRGSDIKKFADYDVAVKSGRLDYEEILLEMALE